MSPTLSSWTPRPRSGRASLALAALLWAGCGGEDLGLIAVSPSQEDRREDGSLYSASTQSLGRGHHWLESVDRVQLRWDRGLLGTLDLLGPDADYGMKLARVPMDQLVPRLPYVPASPPDAFDAYNLMMAEFARNGLSLPVGLPGDTLAHFETDLPYEAPYAVVGDFDFAPKRAFRPYRVSVVNNCLEAGRWELSATDRAGEVYHAWFTFPGDAYLDLVARVNGLDAGFVRQAVAWRSQPGPLELDRLRTALAELAPVPLRLVSQDQPVGFSSQGSRRKLSRDFVQLRLAETTARPETLGQLTEHPVRLTSFVLPGKYSLTERREFDLRFLRRVGSVTVRRVAPHTRYDPRSSRRADHAAAPHLELELELGTRRLLLGNLPVPLLVWQEDYEIHGFGAGVLAAGTPAERRAFLIAEGPAPPYAYLAETVDGRPVALNTHDLGLEQVFIRTRPFGDQPHWEITLTSYERVVDLVKFAVEIPAELRAELRAASDGYVSPLYLSYRDDNLR